MGIYPRDPNDILPTDVTLDMVWPEPVVETLPSIGRGKLWRATFDSGQVFTAMPWTHANNLRVQAAPDDSGGHSIGWIDVRKLRGKKQWTVIVRVQHGGSQRFMYPVEAWVADQPGPDGFRRRVARWKTRDAAIIAGMGMYMAARNRWPGTHEPIVAIRRGGQPGGED